jgi:hypothetical protein
MKVKISEQVIDFYILAISFLLSTFLHISHRGKKLKITTFVNVHKTQMSTHVHKEGESRPESSINQRRDHRSTMYCQEKQSRSSYLWHEQ